LHGVGDLHELDTIGWATVFGSPGDEPRGRQAAGAWFRNSSSVSARHHIFFRQCIMRDLD